jgi:hypothetical protein
MLIVQIVDCLIQVPGALVKSIEPFAWRSHRSRHVVSLAGLEMGVENLKRCESFRELGVSCGIIRKVKNVESPIFWPLYSFNFHKRHTTTVHTCRFTLNVIVVMQDLIFIVAKVR